MLLSRHQPTHDRVIVNILQLLGHHFITGDLLGMKSFLPDLVQALDLVRGPEILELIQQPFALLGLQLVQNSLRGVTLEISQDTRELRRGENGVKMIIPRSQVALGNALVRATSLPRLFPRIAFQQRLSSRKTLMGGGVPPMLLSCHQPAHDQVIVNILQLLRHHFITGDFLGMKSLLPYLVQALNLVRSPEILELIQQPFAFLGLQLIQDSLSGVTLEISQDTREVRRGENGVKMVIQDDPGVNFQGFMGAAILEGVDENIAAS
jgi:hypothetical protein